MYGLSFDLEASSEDNTDNDNYEFYESGCWNSSLQLRVENELSGDYFDEEYEEREEMNESSYGGSDTVSWLVSLGQSLGQSLVLWQPLTYALFYCSLDHDERVNDRCLVLNVGSLQSVRCDLDQTVDVHVESGNEGIAPCTDSVSQYDFVSIQKICAIDLCSFQKICRFCSSSVCAVVLRLAVQRNKWDSK